jgi:hypothetical protein
MGRLFYFGIGGTGSRVLKSLLFLLGSGVEINASEIIAIILDPDKGNGDLNRTLEILRAYQVVHETVKPEKGFFKTKISTLKSIAAKDSGANLSDDFLMHLSLDTQNSKFGTFIDYTTLPENIDQFFVKNFFSEKNLETDLDVGFKGHPNIGSVVLNELQNTPAFATFAASMQKDDRIFIVGSIFGGTGAAGFPLLLKNIRNAGNSVSNVEFLKNATIGGLTVMPYFKVSKNEESQIDSDTFMSKTKAALHYYLKNVKELNAMYYIGIPPVKEYENHEGSRAQENAAHFIEIASALSVVDFMSLNISGDSPTVYKEFGLERPVNNKVLFNDLALATKNLIKKPLSQLYFFEQFLRQELQKSISTQPWAQDGVKFDAAFLQGEFLHHGIAKFNSAFMKWLEELMHNAPSFEPFILNSSHHDIFNLINDCPPKKNKFWEKEGFALFHEELNKASKNTGGYINPEQKFVSIFHAATSVIFDKKFN